MLNNIPFNNNNVNFNQIMTKISKLDDNQLNQFIQKARSLGISELNISQGLNVIRSMRNIIN